MNERGRFLTFFTLLVYIFLVAPLLIIAVTAFGESAFLKFPPEAFSIAWFLNVFKVEMFIRTFIISLQVACISTAIALLIGIPAAYFISRYRFKGRKVMESFFLSPVLIPQIVFGFSLFNFLVIKLKLPVFTGLLIGHTIFIIPYIIRVISASLENFDYEIEEAAVIFGANKFKTFFIIVLPNISSGVVASFILAFINSFNNVPISVFLTGPSVSTLPIQMMSYVEYYFDPTIAALSVLLMIMTTILMFIIERSLGLSYFTETK